MERFCLFIDYDLDSFLLRGLSPSEALDLVLCYVKSLQNVFKLGRAVIYRSDNGFHVRFPFARLSEKEVVFLTQYAKAESGYLYWTKVKEGRQCLRISRKRIVKMFGNKRLGRRVEGSKPELIAIVDPK